MNSLRQYLNSIEIYDREFLIRETNNYLYTHIHGLHYNIVCDETNNTPETIDDFFIVDIYTQGYTDLFKMCDRLTIPRNKKKELRKLRKKKIITINDTR